MNRKRRGEFYCQPNRKSEWATVEEEQQARQAAMEAQITAWRAVIPGIVDEIAKIEDPRRPASIKHKFNVLMFFALLVFALQCTSRREANRELTRPGFLETLRTVFPEIDSCPHMDTVDRLLAAVPAENIEDALGRTVRNLIRDKKLQRMLVDHGYVVAVDGTLKWSTDRQFSPQATTKTHNGSTSYQAYVLEATLVGPQGITIPLMAEFCENPLDGNEQDKQDCESKAFKRLSVKLKSLFPRQRLIIVADGLYPNGPVMDICRANNWDFMIVLPENCLKTVWDDANGIHMAEPGQKLTFTWGNREQEFWWANDIEYDWRDAEGRHRMTIHVVVCNEKWKENGNDKQSTWAWVSRKAITLKNVVERCNGAGRHRWSLEEHLLTEKKRGYNYEHMYSRDWNGMKSWHAMMQLGHLLNTLTLYTQAVWDLAKRLGIRATLSLLHETMAGRWADLSRLARLPEKPQLRLII